MYQAVIAATGSSASASKRVDPYFRLIWFMDLLPRCQRSPSSAKCQYQSFLLFDQRHPQAFSFSLWGLVLPPIQSYRPQS